MAEYSAAELRAAGLEARIEAIPGLVSFPREALLTILSPEHKAIPANTFGYSVERPPDGVCGNNRRMQMRARGLAAQARSGKRKMATYRQVSAAHVMTIFRNANDLENASRLPVRRWSCLTTH